MPPEPPGKGGLIRLAVTASTRPAQRRVPVAQ
jgi:hypothetical protein